MSTRIKRMAVAFVFVMALGASGPAFAGQIHGPGCHGKNQVACRADPQPDRGNDCGDNAKHPKNSNDHCGDELPL